MTITTPRLLAAAVGLALFMALIRVVRRERQLYRDQLERDRRGYGH